MENTEAQRPEDQTVEAATPETKRKINGAFVKDVKTMLTPEQKKAMADYYNDWGIIRGQWQSITGVRMPDD